MIRLKLSLMAVFWSGTFICGRIVADQIEPFSVAALRFFFAAVLLGGIFAVAKWKIPRLSGRQILWILTLGFFSVFAYNALFFTGFKTVTASGGALIIAATPAVVAIGAAVFFRERLNLKKILGIAASLKGALLVISGGNFAGVLTDGIGFGELCFVGCVLCWTAYSLVGRRLVDEFSAPTMVLLSMTAGALMLFVPAVFAEDLPSQIGDFNSAVWLSVLFMAVFSSVLAFIWYYQGIREIGATRASNFINLVPLSAAGLGYFLLDETLSPPQILGGALIIIGVWLVNHGGESREK